MWIYVVKKFDYDSKVLLDAYLTEEEAKTKVQELEEFEIIKNEEYNAWVESDEDEDEMPRDFGDYSYGYEMVWLNK